MEDWEQFFDEKSRRRADKERRRRRERFTKFALLGTSILAAIAIVLWLRR